MQSTHCPKCSTALTPADDYCIACGMRLKKTPQAKGAATYLKTLAIINIVFIIIMFTGLLVLSRGYFTQSGSALFVLVWFGGLLLLAFITFLLEIVIKRAGSGTAKIITIVNLAVNIGMLLVVIYTVFRHMPPITIGAVALAWAGLSFILSILLLVFSRPGRKNSQKVAQFFN